MHLISQEPCAAPILGTLRAVSHAPFRPPTSPTPHHHFLHHSPIRQDYDCRTSTQRHECLYAIRRVMYISRRGLSKINKAVVRGRRRLGRPIGRPNDKSHRLKHWSPLCNSCIFSDPCTISTADRRWVAGRHQHNTLRRQQTTCGANTST